MLIEVKDKVVSTDLFTEDFVCNLSACKGACCIEGDAGAPLSEEEVSILEDVLEEVLPFMRKEGIEAVEEQGVFYLDIDREPVTTLIKGAECAFVVFDANGVAQCAIEKAWEAGKSTFRKPVSCHLYPIRVKQFSGFHALAYDRWDLCAEACVLGKSLQVPVFRFLREPLIRAFGEEFYHELEVVERELKAQGTDE